MSLTKLIFPSNAAGVSLLTGTVMLQLSFPPENFKHRFWKKINYYNTRPNCKIFIINSVNNKY
jgi:hypothetical protein